MFKIGDAVSDVAKGIKTCDKVVSAREMQILGEMYDGFKHPKALAQRAGENIIVNGVDGNPLHHGIVERSYDDLRECVRRYVEDKQKAITAVSLACASVLPIVHALLYESSHQHIDCTRSPV